MSSWVFYYAYCLSIICNAKLKITFLVYSGAHTNGKSWQSYFISFVRNCDENIASVENTLQTVNTFLTPFNNCSPYHISEHTNTVVICPDNCSFSNSLTVYSTMPWQHQPQHCTYLNICHKLLANLRLISIFVSNKPIMSMTI